MRHQASGITDVDIDESAASRRGTGSPARPAALMGVAFVTAAAALALLAFQILTSLADHASGDASLTFPVRGWLESIGAGVETVSMSYVALTDTESRLHATADVLERAWPAALLVAASTALVLIARGRCVRRVAARTLIIVGAWQVAATVAAALITSSVLPDVAARVLGTDAGSALDAVMADLDRASSPVANLSTGHLALGFAIIVIGLAVRLWGRASRPAEELGTHVPS